MFEHIVGNEQAKRYLITTAIKGTVGNSLLFAGIEGIGKGLFAEAFAKLLLCLDDPHHQHKNKIESGNHPDIRIYRPEGKIGMHSIASMRHFSHEVYLSPFEAKWKVFIIYDADRMLTYSANALLKTFEEPAQDTVIILVSSKPDALLPTVFSRCRTIHFNPLSQADLTNYLIEQQHQPFEEANKIALMAQGSIGNALRIMREGTNPLRAVILDVLQKGGMKTYKELSTTASTISEHLEEVKKVVEKETRSQLLHDDLSAIQKQGIEKEIEGVVAMHISHEAYALFDVILAWYRDLHLVNVNGNQSYLLNIDYQKAIQNVSNKENLIPLDTVQKAVNEARLGIDRSTSLNICFENLFLKLNLLKSI